MNAGMKYAIKASSLFDGDHILEEQCILIEDGRVLDFVAAKDLPAGIPTTVLTEGILAPGFVDLQVNGGGGVLLNTAPCRESVNVMTQSHRASGTTAMMPTVISDTREVQQAAIDAVVEARSAGNRGVLGVHLEGPFLDTAKRGAHRADMIRLPHTEDFEWLAGLGDLPVIVTVAPEHIPPGRIQSLVNAGIMVCAGHSNASYQQIKSAVAEGLRGFTHLYNAMGPVTAREPGVVGAALDSDTTWAGIIVDGHHVHPASIRLAHRTKPTGKLLLVSDAMATVGSENPEFDLYGERIREEEGKLVNAEGALAGSAIGMIDAVRISNTEVGLPLEECLRMSSLYPAQFLKRDFELGRIAAHYRADFVHFDENFRVLATWVAGDYRSHLTSK